MNEQPSNKDFFINQLNSQTLHNYNGERKRSQIPSQIDHEENI